MSVVYSQVLSLQNTKKVGPKECVALVQHFTPGVGPSAGWKEGQSVLGNRDIPIGTAIATFVKGRYPSLRQGNHAAFFISQAVNGFWVMDQWRDDGKKPLVSKRLIRTKRVKQLANGTWPDAGKNAYAYSIIERQCCAYFTHLRGGILSNIITDFVSSSRGVSRPVSAFNRVRCATGR